VKGAKERRSVRLGHITLDSEALESSTFPHETLSRVDGRFLGSTKGRKLNFIIETIYGA